MFLRVLCVLSQLLGLLSVGGGVAVAGHCTRRLDQRPKDETCTRRSLEGAWKEPGRVPDGPKGASIGVWCLEFSLKKLRERLPSRTWRMKIMKQESGTTLWGMV